jgi:hypothetical protein
MPFTRHPVQESGVQAVFSVVLTFDVDVAATTSSHLRACTAANASGFRLLNIHIELRGAEPAINIF